PPKQCRSKRIMIRYLCKGPAKAGTHPYASERLQKWVPAFAGKPIYLLTASLSHCDESSAGFHRQAWIIGPFRHRGVVEPHIGVAEHDEGQRVGARRDAAAAIGDRLLLLERADRVEFGAQRRRRHEGAALRVEQRGGRHVDAGGDAAGPAI